MKTGSKVICIDGLFNHPNIGKCFSHLPITGREYTIREIRPINADGGVLLKEIKNAKIFFATYQGYLEPAFDRGRFREIEKEEVEVDRLKEDTKRKELIKSN